MKKLTEEEIERKKEAKRIYDREYRKKNKDKINERIREWCKNNPDKVKRNVKKFYDKNSERVKLKRREDYKNNISKEKEYNKKYVEENKEHIKNYSKKYREENKEYIKEYRKANNFKLNNYIKNRRLNDDLFRIKTNIQSLIRKSFTYVNKKKNTKTLTILGCSYEEFKIHLESKFESWMTWDNQGNPKDGVYELNKTWDVDHVIPLSSAKTEEDIIRLNHYTNLQPLCSYTNRFIKKDTI